MLLQMARNCRATQSYSTGMSVVISPPTNEVDPARQTVPGVGIPFHQIRELRALALNYIQHFIKYTAIINITFIKETIIDEDRLLLLDYYCV